ncbi:unnamed protein product [Hymenolepis diminuta]|uniref:CUE domain-containing protein n=1 Tax=Hymenolepis diminuta TaxID=6216 RepID=A0A0R3SVZ4_HYMDI|nr:unnamed protein product [Hymenolepis diminuta]
MRHLDLNSLHQSHLQIFFKVTEYQLTIAPLPSIDATNRATTEARADHNRARHKQRFNTQITGKNDAKRSKNNIRESHEDDDDKCECGDPKHQNVNDIWLALSILPNIPEYLINDVLETDPDLIAYILEKQANLSGLMRDVKPSTPQFFYNKISTFGE